MGVEQVCTHACNVTHVVADVVGDNRRVAGIVFGNPQLNLTYEVSGNISRFGEDSAASLGKEG